MANRYVATLNGDHHELSVEELTPNLWRLRLGNDEFEVDLQRLGHASYSIIVGSRSFDLEVVAEGDDLIVGSRGGSARVTLVDTARRSARAARTARPNTEGRVELKAMMPGRVVNVLVNVGDEVAVDQGVVVVEAMKMENELKSPKAGKVTEVKVTPGQTVEKGEILVAIE